MAWQEVYSPAGSMVVSTLLAAVFVCGLPAGMAGDCRCSR